MNILERLFGKTEPKRTETFVGSWNGMTFENWRRSTPHIEWMRNQMFDQKFRDMLAVLTNENPVNSGVLSTELTAEIPSYLLGVQRGWSLCLQKLLSLAKSPPDQRREPQVTYTLDEEQNNA